MARYGRRSTSRSAPRRRNTSSRRSSSRSSYGTRSRSAPRRRASGSRAGRSQTIRIEVVQPGVNDIARPPIGMMQAAPARTKSQF